MLCETDCVRKTANLQTNGSKKSRFSAWNAHNRYDSLDGFRQSQVENAPTR